MNQLTFKCKKDQTEFKLKHGITKGQHYEFEKQNPDSYDQQVHDVLFSQGQDFAKSIFEHMQHCDGEIVAYSSTHLIVD